MQRIIDSEVYHAEHGTGKIVAKRVSIKNIEPDTENIYNAIYIVEFVSGNKELVLDDELFDNCQDFAERQKTIIDR